MKEIKRQLIKYLLREGRMFETFHLRFTYFQDHFSYRVQFGIYRIQIFDRLGNLTVRSFRCRHRSILTPAGRDRCHCYCETDIIIGIWIHRLLQGFLFSSFIFISALVILFALYFGLFSVLSVKFNILICTTIVLHLFLFKKIYKFFDIFLVFHAFRYCWRHLHYTNVENIVNKIRGL